MKKKPQEKTYFITEYIVVRSPGIKAKTANDALIQYCRMFNAINFGKLEHNDLDLEIESYDSKGIAMAEQIDKAKKGN
jgi:hypothetical protein